MAKAKKLPSGNWNVLVYDYTDENGKRHYESITAETKADVEYKAAVFKKEHKGKRQRKEELTVGQVVDKYIELSQSLSPTTLASYQSIRDTAFQDLMKMKVSDLDDQVMQIEINKEARKAHPLSGKPLSPKTIANKYGLIRSALLDISGKTFRVKLPRIQHPPKELPEPDVILSAIKGTDIELTCLLSIWLSFSMSEIRGFKCSSIRDGFIYVDQVQVTINGMSIEKSDAKVETRKRRQSVPDYIMDLIEQQENYQKYKKTGEDSFLIPYTKNGIYARFKRITKKLGVEMTFHDLRHMFASVMLTKLQIPEKVVQDEGGWSSPHIMKSVYSNTFTDSRRTADKIRDDFFKSLL